jgi:hypothetical protein
MTRAHWEQFGRPQLTAEVCDRLAKLSYPAEFATAKLYSKKRKRLRDRVGKQVRAIISKTRATTAAT